MKHAIPSRDRRPGRYRTAAWVAFSTIAVGCAAATGFAAPQIAQVPPASEPPNPTISTVEPEFVHRDDAEWLDIGGIDAQLFDEFDETRSIETDEMLPLLRALFGVRRARQLAPDRIEALVVGSPWTGSAQLPGETRDQMRGLWFAVTGRLVDITEIELDESLYERFELEHLYRAEIEIAVEGQGERAVTLTVYLAHVPRAWQKTGELPGIVACNAVLVKHVKDGEREIHPVLVGDRLSWYPRNRIGELGMDMSLFDDVENRTELSPSDHNCFYEMIDVADRSSFLSLTTDAPMEASDVVPLFNDPDASHGRLVVLEGTARSIKRIEVEDPVELAKYGVQQYFEVTIFTESSQGNPIVFCALRLPPGMPVGPDINEHVEVAGFFFKVWRYRRFQPAADAARSDETVFQLAPLVIGPEVIWLPRTEPEESSLLGIVAGAGFLVALAGVWIYVWRGRSQRQGAARVELPAHLDDVV